jgi:hypothetical protein
MGSGPSLQALNEMMPSRSMMLLRMNALGRFMEKNLRRNKDVDYLQLLAITKPTW